MLNSVQLHAHETEGNSRQITKHLMEQMTTFHFPPGVAPEDLPEPHSPGAELLQKYCVQCHEIFSPRMHSAEKWSTILKRVSWHMQQCPIGEKMGRLAGMESPTSKENKELLNYLQKHSLQTADQRELGHLDTLDGSTFLQTCSQCHALPDPKQHTTEEWLAVTLRMEENMQFMHKESIQPEAEAAILHFLTQATSQ